MISRFAWLAFGCTAFLLFCAPQPPKSVSPPPKDLAPYLITEISPFLSPVLGLCGLDIDGRLACWDAEKASVDVIVSLPEVDMPFTKLVGGTLLQCGLGAVTEVDEGNLWCWGVGSTFGLDNVDFRTFNVGAPQRLASIDFMDFHLYDLHVCGITATGTGYCRGDNAWGQIDNHTGNGQFMWYPEWTTISVIDDKLAAVAVGYDFTCVLTKEGVVYCWGYSGLGPAGDWPSDGSLSPMVTTPTEKIAAGGTFACAWTNENNETKVKCWGTLDQFRSAEPTVFPELASATTLSVDGEFACAIVADDEVYCFGDNDYKRTGRNSRWAENWAVNLDGKAVDVETHVTGACAVLEDHRVACWGDGDASPRYYRLFIEREGD